MASTPNLQEAVREARQLGATVAIRRRTGEMTFRHESFPEIGRAACNCRRKDSSKALVTWMRHLRAAVAARDERLARAGLSPLTSATRPSGPPIDFGAAVGKPPKTEKTEQIKQTTAQEEKTMVERKIEQKTIPGTLREPSAPPKRELIEIGSTPRRRNISDNEVSFDMKSWRFGAGLDDVFAGAEAVVVGYDRLSVIDDVPMVYLVRPASESDRNSYRISRSPYRKKGETETLYSSSFGVHMPRHAAAELGVQHHVKDGYKRVCPATVEVIGGRRYAVIDVSGGRDVVVPNKEKVDG